MADPRHNAGYCYRRAYGELVQCPFVTGEGGGCSNPERPPGSSHTPCERITEEAITAFWAQVDRLPEGWVEVVWRWDNPIPAVTTPAYEKRDGNRVLARVVNDHSLDGVPFRRKWRYTLIATGRTSNPVFARDVPREVMQEADAHLQRLDISQAPVSSQEKPE